MAVSLPDPQTIARAALKAHAEGRLCAQNGNRTAEAQATRSFYADPRLPGIGCAVGVALSPDQLDAFARLAADHGNLYTVGCAIARGYVEPMPEPDLQAITRLQELHDFWGSAKAFPSGADTAEECEKEFLDHAQRLAV